MAFVPPVSRKTGLSEALRTFAKAKKTPDTAKEFDDLNAAVGVLGKAITSAGWPLPRPRTIRRAPPQSSKPGRPSATRPIEQLEKDKYQLGLMKASKEADDKLKDLAQRVEDSIKSAANSIATCPPAQ